LKGEIMSEESKVIQVELIDLNLKRSYGPFMHIDEEKAIKGEQKGLWRIVRKPGYEDKMMTAKRETSPLTRADLFGGGQKYSTKGIKKKRVAWVMDRSRNGGAEISCDEVVRVGRLCGFDVEPIYPNTEPSLIPGILSNARFAVINNAHEFPPDSWRMVMRKLYEERMPYVKYEHDHRELGRPDFARRLFARSVLNVFISPIHLKNHRDALGCDGIALPLAVNPAPFLDRTKKIERKPDSALVCNVRNFKSWGTLQKYVQDHPELSFKIFAKDPVVAGENVSNSPMIAYEDMADEYRRHGLLIHLLDGWGAGERVIFEAALSGCGVVANDRAGHMSWGFDLKDKEALAEILIEAPYKFWREMDRI